MLQHVLHLSCTFSTYNFYLHKWSLCKTTNTHIKHVNLHFTYFSKAFLQSYNACKKRHLLSVCNIFYSRHRRNSHINTATWFKIDSHRYFYLLKKCFSTLKSIEIIFTHTFELLTKDLKRGYALLLGSVPRHKYWAYDLALRNFSNKTFEDMFHWQWVFRMCLCVQHEIL